MGVFLEREFVAIFRRPSSVEIVWKQWCTKQDGEFVAELVLVDQDSRYLVDHAMVFWDRNDKRSALRSNYVSHLRAELKADG